MIVRLITSSLCSAIFSSRSMSRAISDDLVTMPILSPRRAGEDLQQAASDLCPPLDRLIGIGRGSNRNLLAGAKIAQFLLQQPRGILLDEDLPLKVLRPAQLHIFMGIAGIAVAAGELAAAIRIDGLREGKPSPRDSAVEDRPDAQRAKLDLMPATHRSAAECQPRNAPRSRGLRRPGGQDGKEGSALDIRHLFASSDNLALRSAPVKPFLEGCSSGATSCGITRPFQSLEITDT